MSYQSSSSELFYKQLIAVGFASAFTELVTYPLDPVKTRMQMVKQDKIRPQLSIMQNLIAQHTMIGVVRNMVKREGLNSLWQGVTPATFRQIIFSGTRVMVYEYLRDDVLAGKTKDGVVIWKSVLSATISGAIAQLLAQPFDLIKTYMQMEGYRLRKGLPPRFHNMNSAFARVIRKRGIFSLWKGGVPSIYTSVIINTVGLTTYDFSKTFLLRHTSMKDDYYTHGLASFITSLAATVVVMPIDTIKIRIMNTPISNRFKGMGDCMKYIYRSRGFYRGFYSGGLPLFARLVPWYMLFWISYEEARIAVGINSF